MLTALEAEFKVKVPAIDAVAGEGSLPDVQPAAFSLRLRGRERSFSLPLLTRPVGPTLMTFFHLNHPLQALWGLGLQHMNSGGHGSVPGSVVGRGPSCLRHLLSGPGATSFRKPSLLAPGCPVLS